MLANNLYLSPNINIVTKILDKFNYNLSIGHLNSVTYVSQYFRSTTSHIIWFTQGGGCVCGNIDMPSTMIDVKVQTVTDLN